MIVCHFYCINFFFLKLKLTCCCKRSAQSQSKIAKAADCVESCFFNFSNDCNEALNLTKFLNKKMAAIAFLVSMKDKLGDGKT
jgi:hypothetical protein